MSITTKRAIFHVICVLSIAIAALFISKTLILLLLGVATCIFLAFEFLRLKISFMNNWFLLHFRSLLRETEVSRITGSSYVLIASFIALLAFERDVAVLALSFMAVGDAIATVVGSRIGKTKFLGKTIEGNIACLIFCIAVGFVYFHAGLDISLLAILIGALAATIIQGITLPINDNLTIPLFSGLVMTLIQL